MVPTVAWMRQKFAEYNEKYFGGELSTPKLIATKLDGVWGKYTLSSGRFDKRTRRVLSFRDFGELYLTTTYSRDEKAVISTLLHEMVHMYLYTIVRIYPTNQHGREFMNAAKNIIADGWNIEAETIQTNSDVENNGEAGTCIIFIIKKDQGQDYKWWICKADENNMQAFEASARKISGVTSTAFFQVKTNALEHVKSDPNTLFGWGGMSYWETVRKMADYCGADPADFNANTMKKI